MRLVILLLITVITIPAAGRTVCKSRSVVIAKATTYISFKDQNNIAKTEYFNSDTRQVLQEGEYWPDLGRLLESEMIEAVETQVEVFCETNNCIGSPRRISSRYDVNTELYDCRNTN